MQALNLMCNYVSPKFDSNYPILDMTTKIVALNNDDGVNIQKDGVNKMFIHDIIYFLH